MPEVLRARVLRRILAAYTVNRFGTFAGVVALSLAVYDRTHSALAVAATLLAAQVVPAFLVPPLIARVEASRRGHELSALYAFEAMATGGIGVLLWHFSLPAILVLVALDGTAALAAGALLRSEAARAAREEMTGPRLEGTRVRRRITERGGDGEAADEERAVQKANAAINVAFSATFVAGPALGGALTALAGAPTALFLDAGTFLVCGALLLDLHPHVEEAGGESVRARLEAAWRYVSAPGPVRSLLVAQGVALIFFESAAPIQVAFAKGTLHAGDGGYGLLVAMWGVGVVVGSVIFARWGDRSLRVMITAGTLAIGLAYLCLGLAPTLAVACAAALLGGIGNGVQWAPLITALQWLTPPALQGRVMGALESIGAVSPAIGLALGGALVLLSTPRTAFLVVGTGAALSTVLFARIAIRRGSVEPAEAGEETSSLTVDTAA